MPLYSAKEPLIELHQWFRNGDHPGDRTINRINEGRIVGRAKQPSMGVTCTCRLCPRPMSEHGEINPKILYNTPDILNTVCPGDYIRTYRDPLGYVLGYGIMKAAEVQSTYELYVEPKE